MEDDKLIRELLRLGKHAEAFRRASHLGEMASPFVQVQLGWMWQTGTGTPKNLQEAEKWYRAATCAESGQAEFFLGSLFREKGEREKALRTFEESARKGYLPAIYHLGRMYMFGRGGVLKDETKAREYIEQAAQRGHLFARRDVAYQMMSGARGVRQMPLGLLSLLGVLWSGFRVAKNDSDSELALRL